MDHWKSLQLLASHRKFFSGLTLASCWGTVVKTNMHFSVLYASCSKQMSASWGPYQLLLIPERATQLNHYIVPINWITIFIQLTGCPLSLFCFFIKSPKQRLSNNKTQEGGGGIGRALLRVQRKTSDILLDKGVNMDSSVCKFRTLP